MVEREGKVAGAVVFREDPELVTTLQIAAIDDGAAADALLAAAGRGASPAACQRPRSARRPARALERLGARAVVRQHEMRLAL